MARRLTPGKLVIASHNAGKVREIGELLRPFGMAVASAGDLGLPVPEERETTFAGNAAIKAHAAARAANAPALADDSGLEIAALGGAPGVHAADWAEDTKGGPRNFRRAMLRVAREMTASGSSDRSARFVCCLCIAWPDGHQEFFNGDVRGEIVWPPRGARGFGYDPIFLYPPLGSTFGEMPPSRKHALSHRAEAFARLIDGSLRR
ncbi:MAG: RdgB/HAM1 family non-canonical purine NTP pyrophosphatase [Alphaproteobacteria bacterium]|nr:RdgB/HAM1 family non-canonical purine NTP pyrophosphatase [Alphaproteobacteria bacterium]